MFLLLLALALVVGVLHGRRKGFQSRQQYAELLIVYLLAGYCGFLMLGVSVWGMISPESAADMLDTEPGNPFQRFFLVAYLGMSVMACLSIWIRDTYLVANIICWSIYWFGATVLHMLEYAEAGRLSMHLGLIILGTHALVPVLLIGLLVVVYPKEPLNT